MLRRLCWTLFAAVAIAGVPLQQAQALPAFALQTGQPCSTCHIGAFGPQLTPFGRQFKLGGYTLRAVQYTPPLALIAIASFLHTAKDQPAPPAPHYGVNDNATIDEIALLVAGGYGDHLGSFVEITYDGIGRSVGLDNSDIRAVDRETIMGSDVILGLSVNNAPTVQDAWATLPVWSFPFTDSALAPTPSPQPVLDGSFNGNVFGTSAYAWWDSDLYTEAGFYTSLSKGILRAVGVGADGTNLIDGAAPYLRVAYQKDYGPQNFEVGAFSFLGDIFPGRDQTTGHSDHFTDVGIDASYQFLGTGEHIATLNARYTHENETFDATELLGGASNHSDDLNEIVLNASYYWQNTIGVTVQHFDTWGSRDALLYVANRTEKPDSSGFLFQIDGTPFGKPDASPYGPWVNVRVGLQYSAYTKFNGAGRNFDGLGTNAGDNDALRLFIWTAF